MRFQSAILVIGFSLPVFTVSGGLVPGKEQEASADKKPEYKPSVGNLNSPTLRHAFSISELQYSPDGKYLASAGGSFVRLWDAQCGSEIHRLSTDLPVVSQPGIAFSPDGRTLVLADGKKVRRWKFATGKELLPLQPSNGSTCEFLVFSPDGKQLAVSGGHLTVWDYNACKVQYVLRTSQPPGRAVAYSPDGQSLAIGDRRAGKGGCVRVYDAANGSLRHIIDGIDTQVTRIAYSPQDNMLATVSKANMVQLWNTKTRKELSILTHAQTHLAASNTAISPTILFVPDGKRVVVALPGDSVVREFEIHSGTCVRQFRRRGDGPGAVAISPDGKLLAFENPRLPALLRGVKQAPDRPGSGTIQVWDLKSNEARKPLCPYQGAVLRLAFAPDGKRLISTSSDGVRCVWDVRTGKPIKISPFELPHPGLPIQPSANLQESLLHDVIRGNQGLMDRYSLLPRIIRSKRLIWSVVSPDGRLGAAVLPGGWGLPRKELRKVLYTVLVYEPGSEKPLRRFLDLGVIYPIGKRQPLRIDYSPYPTGNTFPGSVALSPNARIFAAAGQNGKVVLVDTANCNQLKQLQTSQGWVTSVAFSADGKTLATGGLDSSILLWKVSDLADQKGGKLTWDEFQACWDDLASQGDPRRAMLAYWKIVDASPSVLPYLEKTLRPYPASLTKVAKKLIKQLDHNEFALREAAKLELEKMVILAEKQLRDTLNGNPALEVATRLNVILQRLPPQGTMAPDELRHLRAVGILQSINSKQARQHLTRLSRGMPDALLTRLAKAALQRIDTKNAD